MPQGCDMRPLNLTNSVFLGRIPRPNRRPWRPISRDCNSLRHIALLAPFPLQYRPPMPCSPYPGKGVCKGVRPLTIAGCSGRAASVEGAAAPGEQEKRYFFQLLGDEIAFLASRKFKGGAGPAPVPVPLHGQMDQAVQQIPVADAGGLP